MNDPRPLRILTTSSLLAEQAVIDLPPNLTDCMTGGKFMNARMLLDLDAAKSVPPLIGLPGEIYSFTDDELVVAAQNGGVAAADELLSRHRAFLYKSVLRLSTSKEEAEEAVQEALLRAYLNINRFRRESKFSSWLIAMGINYVLSAKRKSCVGTWISLDDADDVYSIETLASLKDQRPTPEQECLRRQSVNSIEEEMRRLPQKYRVVLQVHGHAEAPIEWSARAVGISVGAFKSRLRRGRSMLLRRLTIASTGVPNKSKVA